MVFDSPVVQWKSTECDFKLFQNIIRKQVKPMYEPLELISLR
jgi:hypothetical protein